MSIKQSKEVGFDHHHAVVIGAGMAGLVAGRILSDHFDSVTVVERDRLPEEMGARRGIPQGQHIHVLLISKPYQRIQPKPSFPRTVCTPLSGHSSQCALSRSL